MGGITNRPVFRKPGKIAAKGIVRCNGHMHRIVLTKSGRLVLVDHPDLKAEMAMVALGGEPCRCLQVLDNWRRGASHGMDNMLGRSPLPRNFMSLVQEKYRKHIGHLSAGIVSSVTDAGMTIFGDSLCATIDVRRQARICKIAWHLLERLFDGEQSIEEIFVRPPWNGGRPYVWTPEDLVGIPVLRVNIAPVDWYKRLYRRGLAVVDGYFAFDFVSETPDGQITVRVVNRDPSGPGKFRAKEMTFCLPTGI